MIRCPHCHSFYPNQIPATKPGEAVVLTCKPSKQWRGRRPVVPEGEKAQWCGKTFTLHVRPEPPSPRESVVAQAAPNFDGLKDSIENFKGKPLTAKEVVQDFHDKHFRQEENDETMP